MYIITDLETTGLPIQGAPPEQQPGITQLGWMIIDEDFLPIEEGLFWVDPEKEIEEAASKITGITRELLKEKGAKPLYVHLPELATLYRRHHTWVGFNNKFDRTVLWYQIARYDWGWKFPWPTNDIDVMSVGKDICNIPGKQGIKPPKLIELHKFLFGEEFESAHDALVDVRATQRCLAEIKKRELI